ncbi:DsbA family protein [Pseudotabrizicola sp.]|uniref:DsbA family protein n=1 Tax=Pseudotabrizicola sp. TaxID=2939647 RepID=UPI003A0FD57D
MRVSQMILVATFALALPEQSLSQEISDDRIKALVAETLRENPELVLEALQALEARQAEAQAATAASVLTKERTTLERDPNAPIFGNPDGDVTIVEFFDYNCPYCKRAMPEVNALMAEDTNVRLVLREWPILSEGSAFAARAALASRQQGKYAEMHDALMTMRGKVEAEAVLRVAGEVGLDIEKLKIDMQSPEVEEHIATSMRLAEALGFNGTPSFVVGDQLIPGFVEKPQLVEAVTAARAVE